MTGQPENEINMLTQAESLLERGQLDAAHTLLSQVLAIAPESSKVHRLIGDFYSAMQDSESALLHYETAVHLDPTDMSADARLKAAQKSVQLLHDPDYGRGTGIPWSHDDWIWEERTGQPTLLVVFAGLGIGSNPPTFIFYNFLKGFQQVDKLFVRDLRRRWYLDGLGDLSRNVEETARLLREKSAEYERTVFVGSSAGGMAAILYGELVEADKVVSFAPQTVLTDAKEREIGDHRWPRLMQKIRACRGAAKFLDLESEAPFSTNIDIHYASSCVVDRKHAERVAGNQVTLIPHDDAADHMIAMHLRDNGELKRIIDTEISG